MTKNERNLNLIKQKDYDKLIKLNQPFIITQAKKYSYDELSFSNYMQAGRIGLYNAAQKFDIEKGENFLTYASHYIKKYIMAEMDNENTIHIPGYLTHGENKIDIQTISTSQQIGDEITLEDTLASPIEDNEIDDNALHLRTAVLKLFNELKPDEKYIVSQYLNFDDTDDKITMKQIGEKMGITRQAVSEKYNRIIKKLKDNLSF